jgi:hypothetical protein
MATLTASPSRSRTIATTPQQRAAAIHRTLMSLSILVAVGVILYLIIHGASYYILSLEQRPFSPLHSQLRSSGTLGLRLGLISVGMFGVLFLYPLRKRWKWLSTIGNTRRWLNFHILFGVTTPVIVTFHTAFRTNGVAGVAYWTMIAVALSGFVGRYVYGKIPRSLSSVKLSMEEVEDQMKALASRLREQEFFRESDLASLLNVPASDQVRSMSLMRTLWVMLRMDLARPFHVSRLRRRALSGRQMITTLGGFLASHDHNVESVVASIRRQSRLRTAMAFLDRSERVFQLWHVVHRPFSITFVALILIHIGVALSVGFY